MTLSSVFSKAEIRSDSLISGLETRDSRESMVHCRPFRSRLR